MHIAIAAALGLLLGHAADLAYPRLFTGTAPMGATIRCSGCRAAPRPAEFVPFVGVLQAGMRCRRCGVRLPLRALVLPAGGAALFAVSDLEFGDLGVALLAGFFATVFLLLVITDVDQGLLPNRIIYPSAVIAIAVSWAWPDSPFLEVLSGGLVALLISLAILLCSLPFGANAFGMGDVKMIVLVGLVVGFPSVLVAIFIGLVSGAAGAAALIATRRRGMRDFIPHGPFLAIGGVIALFWGSEIWDAYTR